jgi:hypothetical protein
VWQCWSSTTGVHEYLAAISDGSQCLWEVMVGNKQWITSIAMPVGSDGWQVLGFACVWLCWPSTTGACLDTFLAVLSDWEVMAGR